MLPRLQSSAEMNKSLLYSPTAPPEIKPVRGVDNLKNLKEYCDKIYAIHTELAKECIDKNRIITRLSATNEDLVSDQSFKQNLISELKSKLEKEKISARTREESERLLITETKHRRKVESELQTTTILLQDEKLAFSRFKETVIDNSKQLLDNAAKIKDLEQKLYVSNREKVDLQFSVDSLKVDLIKIDRTNQSLLTEMKAFSKKNSELVENADNLTLENSALQKKVRELLDANKEVTVNYQFVKKNFDTKKKEAEEIALECEEAKNACQVLIKQKRSLKEENEIIVKQKLQLETSLNEAKSELISSSADNEDLRKRITELEIEEERLKKQLRSTTRLKGSSANLLKGSSSNMLKGSSTNMLKASTGSLLKDSNSNLLKDSSGNLLKGSRSDSPKGSNFNLLRRNSANSVGAEIPEANNAREERVNDDQEKIKSIQLKMDETIADLKTEYEKIQSELCDELDFARRKFEEKVVELEMMKSTVLRLEEEQYLPRMQYLQTIETNMKEKLLELVLEDEKIELSLICPRDLKLLDHSTTLFPCNHTFCQSCVNDMISENFDQLKCDVCNRKASAKFPNYKLDVLKDLFIKRKDKTKLIFDW